MLEVGDVVLHDILVGTVYEVGETIVLCNCSDGMSHTFESSKVMPVASYMDILKQLKGGILNYAER